MPERGTISSAMPINARVRDGWVVAEETTLGADNGIGVALALAALEEPGLVHPPLEVLLTVNEESGMDGARGLAAGTLQGKTLINLDTEEWGHFYLGCAGGVDVEVRHDCEQEEVPPDYAIVRFDVSGLRGGHSGIDIHLVRGNAIKLLAEALRDLSLHTDLRLIEMKGGTARNAIPREAYAVCAVPLVIASTIDVWVQHRLEAWRQRYAEEDANVSFVCGHDDTPPGKCHYAHRPGTPARLSRHDRKRGLAHERCLSRRGGYLGQPGRGDPRTGRFPRDIQGAFAA